MEKENGKWHLFIQVYQHSFVLILIKKDYTLFFLFIFSISLNKISKP